jgi:hypothetical protein
VVRGAHGALGKGLGFHDDIDEGSRPFFLARVIVVSVGNLKVSIYRKTNQDR